MTKEQLEAIRDCLPKATDGPDYRTYCSVLGSDLRDLLDEVDRLTAENERLSGWRDEAVANCAKRQCGLREHRLMDAEAENERLRAVLLNVRITAIDGDIPAAEACKSVAEYARAALEQKP